MSFFPPPPRPCACGSGQMAEEVCDAKGIYVARVCDACRADRLAGYRDEIFTDPNYDCDEDVESDPEPGYYEDGCYDGDYGGALGADGQVYSDADPGL